MKSRFAEAFDQGQVPTIVLVNEATQHWGVDPAALAAALQKFVDTALGPVWGTPCTVRVSSGIEPGAWAMVFLDNADQAGALGYHDLTPEGLPLSKIFVHTTIADGQKVSVTACHELAEMLVDPAVSVCSQSPDGTIYAYEVCDAVEEDEFLIDGISMSNFVFPSWFEGFRAGTDDKFDHLGLCAGPYEIRHGGYMPVLQDGQWTQVFGSKTKQLSYAHQDRRGHRTPRRGRIPARSTASDANLGQLLAAQGIGEAECGNALAAAKTAILAVLKDKNATFTLAPESILSGGKGPAAAARPAPMPEAALVFQVLRR